MDGSSPEQHGKLFTEKLSELEQQQELLARRIKKLRCHIQAVKTLTDLREHPYQKSDIDTECIVSFDLIERDKLRQYIESPYLYSRVQHSQTLPQERRGLTVPADMRSAFPESSVLWQKQSSRYVTFLMSEEVTAGFPNDLAKHLAHIQKSHRTGAIISRFLLCAQENGKIYDFYKTFVEILPEAMK